MKAAACAVPSGRCLMELTFFAAFIDHTHHLIKFVINERNNAALIWKAWTPFRCSEGFVVVVQNQEHVSVQSHRFCDKGPAD